VLLTSERGARFAVHDLGGDGPAVLICHATGFCGMAYARLGRVLSREFHVWALDFAGHGDSDLPAGDDFAWSGMIEYVVAAAQAVSPQAPLACAVGHSMGAAIALQAATEHPRLARCLYVYEPAIVPTPVADRPAGSPNPMADGARRRQPQFPSREAALRRYASRPPLNGLEAGSLAAYVEHGFADSADGTVMLKCLPASEARTFEAGGRIAVSTVSPAVPTLCVSGDPGQPLAVLVPPLSAALPHAELRQHRHLGHFGPLESPGLIGDEILAFIGTAAAA
jgi:pimeloyl-ACP methyl ester carboxylesterase